MNLLEFRESLTKQLEALFSKPTGYGFNIRTWLEFEKIELKVYLRITQRHIEGKIENTLDLSSVEVGEDYQKKGYFSVLLDVFEQVANNQRRYVYVESVLNPVLEAKLLKSGYTRLPELPDCFYKGFKNGEIRKTDS